jgi:hypothetical protein
MLAYIEHAKQHYRRANGTNTDELSEYKRISKLVREVYGNIRAAEFGPSALKVIRQNFINQDLSRGFINQRIGKVRRIFKWGVSEELIQPSTYQAVSSVSDLQRGRTEARETEPVGPVDDAVVETTLNRVASRVESGSGAVAMRFEPRR